MRYRQYDKSGDMFVDGKECLGRERWFQLSLAHGEDPGLSAPEHLVAEIVAALNFFEVLREKLGVEIMRGLQTDLYVDVLAGQVAELVLLLREHSDPAEQFPREPKEA